MTSIYLSPQHPQWRPKTEADLQAAIDDGILEESHHLDLKRQVNSKQDNRELARDLASFAIDGGVLLIGIEEDTAKRTLRLAPQSIAGLAEKVERVARDTKGLLLNVTTETIAVDGDPSRGYLLVHIPASPAAPHMVDGLYYGRGDKTKHVLSDAEVVRLHERRRGAGGDVAALLRHEIDRDPIPPDARKHAHLFLVAQPQSAPQDMLLDLTSSPEWNMRLGKFVKLAYAPAVNLVWGQRDASPHLLDAHSGQRRARGVARVTNNLRDGRIFTPGRQNLESVMELQVHEDGGLRLFSSRLSRPDNTSDGQFIIHEAVVGNTYRFVALVTAAAAEAGYLGTWALAIGATALRGLSVGGDEWDFSGDARYDEDAYTRTTAASWAELSSAPGSVTKRLAGPLLRAFEIEGRYSSVFADRPQTGRS